MPKINFKQPGEKPMKLKIELDFKRVNIGRSEASDIVLTNPSISASHCYLKRVKGGFRLVDNNSTNGMKVDDRECKMIDVNTDRQFYIGDVIVQFAFTDEEFDLLDEEGEFVTKESAKTAMLKTQILQ